MTLIIFATSLLIAYIVAFCIRHETIPDSLSASVFYMPKTCIWAWTIVIAAVTFALAPILISSVSDSTTFLAFLAGAGLLFVAGSPLEKDKSELSYKVHCGGAIVCAIASQILIGLNMPLLLLCWAPWVLYYAISELREVVWRRSVFFAEMTCFFNIILYCFLNG